MTGSEIFQRKLMFQKFLEWMVVFLDATKNKTIQILILDPSAFSEIKTRTNG